MKTLLSKIGKSIAALVVAGGLLSVLVLPAGSVFAQTGNPPTPATPTAEKADKKAALQQRITERLEKTYQRELERSQKQDKWSTGLDTRLSKFSDRITKLQGEGKNVDVLQKALANVQSVFTTAQADHKAAADILANHVGFDANGKVTDVVQARGTVNQVEKLLNQSPLDLRVALRDMVQTIRDFVQQNHKQ